MRDVVQNHLLQLMALIAMEPPTGGSDPDPVRDKKLDLFRSITAADPAALRARPVRRLPRRRGRRTRLADRDLRRAEAVRRELALGRRSLLHPRRQVPGGEGDRAAGDLQQPARDRDRRQRDPEVRRDRDPDRPRGRRLLPARGQAARRGLTAPDRPGPAVRAGAGRPAGALRAAARRRPGRRPRTLRARGHGRGDLAHRAAADRRPARRSSPTSRAAGAPRRRRT